MLRDILNADDAANAYSVLDYALKGFVPAGRFDCTVVDYPNKFEKLILRQVGLIIRPQLRHPTARANSKQKLFEHISG